MRAFRFILVLLVLGGSKVQASPFKDFVSFREKLGFTSIDSSTRAKAKVKVAILDNGFKGYKELIGRSLPETCQYHEGKLAPPENEESHGLVMAQLLSALVLDEDLAGDLPLELHLYPSFGYTNFAHAIDEVVKGDFDVVLYSQVWEYGGNFDGTGFIDEKVKEAIDSGVLWINAAGNFGEGTFNSKIKLNEEKWVELPGSSESVQLKCKPPKKQKTCSLRAVLSWNDFKDNIDEGTAKDLDLILTNDTLDIIQTAGLTQSEDADEKREGYSKYPREILEKDLKEGTYLLRVKAKSKNFSSDSDKLRITTSGDGIELLNRDEEESLLNPADIEDVITVGASDSDQTSKSEDLEKPEIYAPSAIELKKGGSFKGTSQAAAIVAAGAAVLKSFFPDLTKESFLEKVSKEKQSNRDRDHQQIQPDGPSIRDLDFSFTGPNCFRTLTVVSGYPALDSLLSHGGTMVETTHGLKIFIDQDPFRAYRHIQRQRADDMMVVTPNGMALGPRSMQGRLPLNIYEVVQAPYDIPMCGFIRQGSKNDSSDRSSYNRREFYLPDISSMD